MITQTRQPEFGRRLRQLRLDRGLRQSDLAAERMSMAYISMLERGHRSPSPRVVNLLAARLGVETEELTSAGAPSCNTPPLPDTKGPLEAVVHAAGPHAASLMFTRAASALLLLGQPRAALRSARSVLELLTGLEDPAPVEVSHAHLVSAQAHLEMDNKGAALDSIRSAGFALDLPTTAADV